MQSIYIMRSVKVVSSLKTSTLDGNAERQRQMVIRNFIRQMVIGNFNVRQSCRELTWNYVRNTYMCNVLNADFSHTKMLAVHTSIVTWHEPSSISKIFDWIASDEKKTHHGAKRQLITITNLWRLSRRWPNNWSGSKIKTNIVSNIRKALIVFCRMRFCIKIPPTLLTSRVRKRSRQKRWVPWV